VGRVGRLGLTNNGFFGRPWENRAMYDSLSPIRHVKNVKTPTLMVQSEGISGRRWATPTCGTALGLRCARGIRCLPRSTHELSRSGEPWLLSMLGRIRQWFDYWLIQGGPAPKAVQP
jgi:hypothetical protein